MTGFIRSHKLNFPHSIHESGYYSNSGIILLLPSLS